MASTQSEMPSTQSENASAQSEMSSAQSAMPSAQSENASSQSNDDSWKDDVTDKLIQVFKYHGDMLLRIFYYLSDYYCADSDENHFVRKLILLENISVDDDFEQYAEELIQKTETTEVNVKFLESLKSLGEHLLKLTSSDVTFGDDFDLVTYVNENDVIRKSGVTYLQNIWKRIPEETQSRILKYLPQMLKPETAEVPSTSGVNFDGNSLPRLRISSSAKNAICQWWKSEISGFHCAKIVTASSAEIDREPRNYRTADEFLQKFSERRIYKFIRPIGIEHSGILPKVALPTATSGLRDRLSQYLFGVPQSIALSNAYEFFSVRRNASDGEINRNFEGLCRKCVSTGNGNAQDFYVIQINMAVIKAARGELQQ